FLVLHLAAAAEEGSDEQKDRQPAGAGTDPEAAPVACHGGPDGGGEVIDCAARKNRQDKPARKSSLSPGCRAVKRRRQARMGHANWLTQSGFRSRRFRRVSRCLEKARPDRTDPRAGSQIPESASIRTSDRRPKSSSNLRIARTPDAY